MAKLACILVLALFALQGNSTLLKEVNIQLPEGTVVFSEKVKEIKEKYNLEAVIEETKEDLKNALAAHQEDERLCKPEAQKFLDALVKDAQSSAAVCDNNVQEYVASLKDKFVQLNTEIFELSNSLANKIHSCRKEHLRDVAGFFTCVEENTKDIHQQIAALETEIQKLSVYALESAQDALNKYDECLSEVKNKLILEGRAISSALEQCIQNADKLFFRMLCWPNVHNPLCDDDFDYYRSNPIDEVFKNHNLHKVIAQLKLDVEELLKVNDKVQRLCGPKSLELVDELSKESQAEAGVCMMTMTNPGQTNELNSCLARVENKFILESRAIVSNLNQCIENTKLLYRQLCWPELVSIIGEGCDDYINNL